MSTTTAPIYFVAGASRGIGASISVYNSMSFKTYLAICCTGLALVNAIASTDPTAIVYAGARDTSAAQIKEVAGKYPGRVVIVKYVAGDKEGNDAIATEIKGKYGRVDTVIANAGEVPIFLLSMIQFTYTITD